LWKKKRVVILWQLPGGTHPLYNLMWHWCGQDKWGVKEHSSVALRVIFRVYMFGVLSKTLPSIFHQGLRSSEFESQISWISPLLSPPLQSYPLLSPKLLSPPSILDHLRFSHHRRSPPSMVSHRHSPPQPLSHEISLMQMGALDSFHVSNPKFRYLKSNYVIS